MKKFFGLILVISTLLLCSCSFATAEKFLSVFTEKESNSTAQSTPMNQPFENTLDTTESQKLNDDVSETQLPQTTAPALPETLPIETVIPASTPETEKVPPHYKLALTFDDGPSAHTDRLLDIFKEYGGKATFFVVGNMIGYRTETLKRIADEGHEIGNHSWSHVKFTDLDPQEMTAQIMLTKNKIFDITGKECNIVRPPYGAYNKNVEAVGTDLGVSFIGWSVDTLDWKTRDELAIYDEIISTASNGAIILCHDLHGTTVDAMEMAIPELIARGYQLVTVSELLSNSESPLKPGQIYYKQQ